MIEYENKGNYLEVVGESTLKELRESVGYGTRGFSKVTGIPHGMYKYLETTRGLKLKEVSEDDRYRVLVAIGRFEGYEFKELAGEVYKEDYKARMTKELKGVIKRRKAYMESM